MIVSITSLTKAVEKVKSFADSSQNIPGILFDIRGDELRVCYSDGKKSIIEKIQITPEEGDVQGKIVVGYNRMLSIIDMCRPSGEIRTDDITIKFLEGNVMSIEIVKTMLVQRNTGNVDEEGEAIYAEESKVVSKFNQILNYNYTSDNLRYGILDRMNYDDIFVDAEGNSSEDADFDTWDKEELKNILSKTSTEKGKTVYVSSKVNGGFVSNSAYVVFIPTDSCSEHGFAVSTLVAKSLVEILNKIDEDQVRVCKKDRYVSIINGTDTVGIWLEMSPASKTDLATLNLYSNKSYDTFELVFSRAALNNVLSCAATMTKDEKTFLTFKEVDGYKSLVIASGKNTGDFNVTIEGNQDNIKNWESLKETTLPLSMKVLSAMLNDCSTTYVSLDVLSDETGKFIRVSELLGRDETGEKMLGATHYTVASK